MEKNAFFLEILNETPFFITNNKKKQKRDKKRKKDRLHTFFTAILDGLLSRQTNKIFFKGIFQDSNNLTFVPDSKNC